MCGLWSNSFDCLLAQSQILAQVGVRKVAGRPVRAGAGGEAGDSGEGEALRRSACVIMKVWRWRQIAQYEEANYTSHRPPE